MQATKSLSLPLCVDGDDLGSVDDHKSALLSTNYRAHKIQRFSGLQLCNEFFAAGYSFHLLLVNNIICFRGVQTPAKSRRGEE